MDKIGTFILLILFCCSLADYPVVHENGIGTRAMSMANTFVALADDYSAIYWNPAGLGFLPVREVQVSMDFLLKRNRGSLGEVKTDMSKQRFRLDQAGFVRSIPTTQGGVSFAFGFSSPIIFDNLYQFQGWDKYLGSEPDTSSYLIAIDTIIINDTVKGFDTTFDILTKGDLLYTDTMKNNTHGQLNMLTGAAGWQITPGLSFGVSVSLLYGKEYQKIRFKTYNEKALLFAYNEEKIHRTYIGFDMRAGLLYKPIEWLRFGITFNAPQSIHFEEEYQFNELYYGYKAPLRVTSGTLSSSFSGSAGGALHLPFFLFTSQVNFRTPMANIEEPSEKQYWKNGVSFGVEIPIPGINTQLRGGYSWSELALYPYHIEYKQQEEQINEPTLSHDKGRHQVTSGLTIFLNDAFAFEAAYSVSLNEFSVLDNNWHYNLKERHTWHRVQCSFSLHY